MDPFFSLGLFLSKFINTFFHEVGHAIPALKFTDDDVIINIGSYEDIEYRKPIFIYDRLKIYFNLNSLIFGGYCRFSDIDNLTMDEYILIVFGGPLASIIITIFYLIMYLIFKDYIYISNFILGFLITGLADILMNILPLKMSNVPTGQGIMYNDGYQLKELIDEKRFLDEKYTFKYIIKKSFYNIKDKIKSLKKKRRKKENSYQKAINLFNLREYNKAISELEKIITQQIFFAEPYRIIIDCYIKTNNFENAFKYHEVLKSRFELNEEDKEKFNLIISNIRTNN